MDYITDDNLQTKDHKKALNLSTEVLNVPQITSIGYSSFSVQSIVSMNRIIYCKQQANVRNFLHCVEV